MDLLRFEEFAHMMVCPDQLLYSHSTIQNLAKHVERMYILGSQNVVVTIVK